MSQEYIARISYGKDSLKMLDVIFSRGLPIDRITTTDVWATDTVSANLPEMDEFKARMDERIWWKYRIEVEHLCARNKDGTKRTYEQMFYHVPVRRSQNVQVERERERDGHRPGSILGFPDLWNPWCQAGLKRNAKPPCTGNDDRVPSPPRIQLLPEAQTCADPRDSRRRFLPGAENSKSTRSEHLFHRAPGEAQGQKYHRILRHRCGRADPHQAAHREARHHSAAR